MRLSDGIRSLILLFFISANAFAQSDTVSNHSITYFNQLLSGGAFPQKAEMVTFTATTFHGARNKQLGIGIGTSYDSYVAWKCLSMLTGLTYDFSASKKGSVFIQFDAGIGKIWRLPTEIEHYNYDQKGGRFIHPAIGYRLKRDKWSIYVKTGYKFHRLKYDMTPAWWSMPGDVEHVTQDVQRVIFQIGFGFN